MMEPIFEQCMESAHSEYAICRIPGLIRTAKGTLIAYYECRRESRSDWAEIDLKWIRSCDRGTSWEPMGLLRGEGNTLNNPVMISHGERIHFLFCKNYKDIYHAVSEDDGRHFSEPRRLEGIAEGVQRFYNVVAVGPGHGIVHGNRLLVPVWFAYNEQDPHAHHPSFVSTLYSEDGGEHWQVGEILPTVEAIPDPNESALAVTADGQILMSIRNESTARMRALAFSSTGKDGWSQPKLWEQLPDPVCQGSMFHHDGRIYHINCTSQTHRTHLTVKLSDDAFRSFREYPVSERGGYSDLAVAEDELYILFERDAQKGSGGLFFQRIPLSHAFPQTPQEVTQ